MRVAIVGYGLEGQSALVYWENLGAEVTVCDQNQSLQVPMATSTQLGPEYLHDLDRFDLIVRSAGIHPSIILAKNPGVAGKITTVINEFLRVCPTKNIIGVTGTKGKGTTCTLTAQMLEAAGKDVFLAGNIGLSPLDFLPQMNPDSWVVLELSSFQLSDLKYSPHIGVCLMVVPEHLNWHDDMDDYIQAKSQLFVHQTPQDIAIYFANNTTSHTIASQSPGAKITYFASPGAAVENNKIVIDNHEICDVGELKLLGRHNWENACAAVTAVWQVVQAPDAIRKVLITFAGLPHRLEFVREVSGIRFYNDSFAAGLHATEAAINAITGSKVLIVGGFDRMLPLEHFGPFALKHDKEISHMLLIGASAQRLATILEKNGYHNFTISTAQTMEQIVQEARSFAHRGESVLLSPGFASFDMFKNFEDRGNQFKQVVHAL